jgi:uncharacterized 2Fe-2S/4Fe-4S cluster protein (DUF4445 family)
VKSSGDIDDLVVVGNTTMQHIFAGIDPGSLGRTPFLPVVDDALILPAHQLGFSFSPGAQVYVMPVIAGFAGGDTVACALADHINTRDEMSLIVDVGTNGELLLGNRQGLWSTSCATGPAFEGAQISCGMRATDGAICACEYSEASSDFICQTMGTAPSTPPLGICGSGVIDAVAAMRRACVLQPSGRLSNGSREQGGKLGDPATKTILVAALDNPAGVDIYLSQGDIRQVQLAKAALATGIICLMETAGVKRVDRTILTGAFGNAFNWHNAAFIGMLPDEAMLGQVKTMTNLAGEGAVMTLLDRHQRREADAVCRQTTYLDLANEPAFVDRFVSHTVFPSGGRFE